MKKLKFFFVIVFFCNLQVFSQEDKVQKEDLYILFNTNDKNNYIKNDSIVYLSFYLNYNKFNDAKSIELKIDSNNNLEKINWISGSTSSGSAIRFYYLSNNITSNERAKVNLKNLKNLLEEDEIIKYVEFSNLKEILTKFNIYAIQKEGEEYFAWKVEYSIL